MYTPDPYAPTAEEIENAKSVCMCGYPVNNHPTLNLGHAPLSQWDYYKSIPFPKSDRYDLHFSDDVSKNG